jgi:transposase
LIALVIQQNTTILSLVDTNKILSNAQDEFSNKINLLQLQLADLRKFIFSGKQEKFKPNPDATDVQMALFAKDKIAEVVVDKIIQIPAHTQTKTSVRVNHPGRSPLPDHLRRVETIISPLEDVSLLKKIGEEVTELLEYQQGELYVKKIIRPEYIQPSEDGLNAKRIIAPMPSLPFPKSYVGASLLAYLLVSKFVDHLPIYRILQMFKRQKVSIPDSTVVNWIEEGYKLLEPLYELYQKLIFLTGYLHVDETAIKVLDKSKKGTTHQGYYWVYYDGINKNALFKYAPGRDGAWPKETLSGFEGYMQVDGYDGYNQFKTKDKIQVLHCWAHVRRKFFDIQGLYQEQAEYILTQIQKLYTVERHCREEKWTNEQIVVYRQEHAKPILSTIFNTLKEYQSQEVLPSSPLGKAINYTLNLWGGLEIYLEQGYLQIDNNPVENSIRPVAIGRKNYLFAGSHKGAERSAMFYSLFASCKTHNIEPQAWLTYVLENINDYKLSELHQLLPQNYKPVT